MGKRIVQATLDDILIMGDESVALGIKILERKTRVVRECSIQFPALEAWDDYVTAVAAWLYKCGVDYHNLEIPDDMEDLADPKTFQQWAAVTSTVMRIKVFRDEMKRIFFDYLDPYITGMEPDESEDWLKHNCSVKDVFHMLVAVLHVEDWLKKKATFILTETFPEVMQSSSSRTSEKNLEAPQRNGSKRLSSRYASYSGGKPSIVTN